MPEGFSLSSTDTIKRSPALNAPSSQSAAPRRTESWFSRPRTRSSTSGRRSLLQGLSPSRSLAVPSSRIGGSTVLSAVNIHVIARARPLVSSGSRPAWRSAIWNTIAPRLEQGAFAFFTARNLPERMKHTTRGFLHLTERKKTNFVWHFFLGEDIHSLPLNC